MDKRRFLTAGASIAGLAVLNAACTTTSGGSGDPVEQRRAIDAAADSALSRLYEQVRDSRELVSRAQGVLILPAVVSGGFIVGGAGGGTGRPSQGWEERELLAHGRGIRRASRRRPVPGSLYPLHDTGCARAVRGEQRLDSRSRRVDRVGDGRCRRTRHHPDGTAADRGFRPYQRRPDGEPELER